MTKILKYHQHENSLIMAEEFIECIINNNINESVNSNDFLNIIKKLSSDLKFNLGLIFTFGTGINVMYPIVENLIKNGNIKIELTHENIVLLLITSLTITYLEEKKKDSPEGVIVCNFCNGLGKSNGEDSDCSYCDGVGKMNVEDIKSDIKNLLEELKLRGIGNGIVKKMVSCIKAISNLVKLVFKNSQYTINGLVDMFAYTSILIPTMNAIGWMINKYGFTLDTLVGNFLSIGVGVSTIFAKHGLKFLIDKIKDKFDLKYQSRSKNGNSEINDGDGGDLGDNILIKEQ